jgi:hypothetical protein
MLKVDLGTNDHRDVTSDDYTDEVPSSNLVPSSFDIDQFQCGPISFGFFDFI